MMRSTNCGEKKMKKNVIKTATLTTGTFDEFVARSKERAKKLDRGERIPPEIRVTFEDPADLLRALSAERLRVLKAIHRQTKPTISGLAMMLKRERKAVSRDVKLLESFGL